MSIAELRASSPSIIMIGSHPGVIQSMLDYDFMIGRAEPSVIAVIVQGRKLERYFWGTDEVIIPAVPMLSDLKKELADKCTVAVNVQSARRVLSSTKEAVAKLPNLKLISIFAEQTPETHSLELRTLAIKKNVLIVGPSSVGVLLPGTMKIGAIGGTQYPQLVEAKIAKAGKVAVISTSGGMVNELIHIATGSGQGVSFAIALGGDRFPVTDPMTAMLLAQNDELTERIIYFGELGGTDEYEIARLIDEGKLTKPIIAYVAGVVAELFDTPPQFGHAKALAQTDDESATAKKDRLRKSGVIVCDHLGEIADKLDNGDTTMSKEQNVPGIGERKKRAIISHISGDKDGEVQLLGHELLETIERNSIASLVLSLLLGKQVESKRAIDFTDLVLRMLVDHGPYVSGAVNTIITARAGRDLVSGLTAGLLTIGPRFGGAINEASRGWVDGATSGVSAKEFVDSYVKQGGIIAGIGHKKYRIDMPDPRVEALMQFSGNSNGDRYLKFARSVEEITTTKKGNLILNIDGAIGAVMLDILESELGYKPDELRELADIEFFNALFVLSRSIGFTAHYLDQRRNDEGLFRLDTDDVRYIA
ncbi:MAG: ATPcitrate synthase [Candidatus Saccharibacteria bacterium]|nr:ATPcitrate synthase [Candidatus Saccharibacteria bacterium]